MVTYSIIFFDEAYTLFHDGSPNDRSWERSPMNQLLTTTDGLVKVKHSPFVLLATSILLQLDHAVLWRAPFRLHVGRPPGAAWK